MVLQGKTGADNLGKQDNNCPVYQPHRRSLKPRLLERGSETCSLEVNIALEWVCLQLYKPIFNLGAEQSLRLAIGATRKWMFTSVTQLAPMTFLARPRSLSPSPLTRRVGSSYSSVCD